MTAAKIDAATRAEERGLHARYGCKNVSLLLREKLKLNQADATRRARLVHELPALPRTREAVYSGVISGEHALVISDAIKRLPDEHVEQADQALAGVAPTLPPRDLMRVGKHLWSLVAPDGVYRDEQEGIAKRSLRMGNDQDGCLHVKAVVDPLNGEKIRTFLLALSKPKTVNGEKDPRSSEQRLADAFIEAMTTAMSAKDLPVNGGMRTQLIVIMDFDALAQKMGCDQTQNGDPISAGLMRQAACDAGVIPIVLGGESEPLDYGRERRLASPAGRRALVIRNKGCAFPGCDRPPAWTEAHHVWQWIDGGPTDLSNLILLCVHHHHVVHEGDWEIVFEHGIPSFIPPRWVDPEQTPVRNIRVDLPLRL
ncbi:HNH endonuclease [Allokutzneria albata]|uniref:HNH endonuclease n=1 Tax=Allokutzneria albata TaxID=211114 RepID=A0A1G9T6P0_ALLAB|nr:HNH endonuclease [Allokutzneria albata]